MAVKSRAKRRKSFRRERMSAEFSLAERPGKYRRDVFSRRPSLPRSCVPPGVTAVSVRDFAITSSDMPESRREEAILRLWVRRSSRVCLLRSRVIPRSHIRFNINRKRMAFRSLRVVFSCNNLLIVLPF